MAGWMDGRRVEAPVLPATDRGFLWGEGVFTTVRVWRGLPFRLEAHLERLRGSLAALGLPPVENTLARASGEAIRMLAATLPKGTGRARLTVTAGDADPGGDPAVPPAGPARLLITVVAGEPRSASAPGAGMKVASCGPEEDGVDGLGEHKTLAWLPRLRVLRAARQAGLDEGLRLTRDGRVLGGSRSNLFLVRAGDLVTPPPGRGCLPGITRRIVLTELAPALGVAAEERDVHPDDLRLADGAFLTGSIQGVAPVGELQGRVLSGGSVGNELSVCISRAYEEILAAECGGA